jgi:hypothetical protein
MPQLAAGTQQRSKGELDYERELHTILYEQN